MTMILYLPTRSSTVFCLNRPSVKITTVYSSKASYEVCIYLKKKKDITDNGVGPNRSFVSPCLSEVRHLFQRLGGHSIAYGRFTCSVRGVQTNDFLSIIRILYSVFIASLKRF